jgi:hypothetical protein
LPLAARSAPLALAVQLDNLAVEVPNIELQLMAWHRQSAASQSLETNPGAELSRRLRWPLVCPTRLSSNPAVSLRPTLASSSDKTHREARIVSGIYRIWATAIAALPPW